MEETGFRQALQEIAKHTSRRRHMQFWATMVLMVLGAAAEAATIGAVVPFLAIIATPVHSARAIVVRRAITMLHLPPDLPLIYFATGVLIAVAVVSAIVRLSLIYVTQKFIFGVGYDIGIEVYRRTLHQPYSFHVARNTSDIISGINKVQLVLNGVLRPVMALMTSGVVALFIVAGLLFVDPMAATVAIGCFSAIYITVSFFARRILRANSRLISKAHNERIKAVQEGLGGIRDIILDRSQSVFLRSFTRADAQLREAQAANSFIGQAPRYIVEAFGIVLIAFLAVYLSNRAGGLAAAIPTLGALALGAQRLMPLIQQIYTGWSQVLGNAAVTEDVIALLQGAGETRTISSAAVDPMPFTRDIVLSDLSFHYPGSRGFALENINLGITKGERIGVIGKTGSGKSTIIDIIMALLEPSSGEVRIDGQPLNRDNHSAWQAQIAHVPQAIYLADNTMAANIAFGVRPNDIDMARVQESARKADIHNFIMSLPNQYETGVGEQGVRISGGQRQRIGIARALYKQASVLILDEATSALDDQTEASVMESIDALSTDLTVLMIAHRLSTVRRCDRVMRVADGRVVALGSFEEVVAAA